MFFSSCSGEPSSNFNKFRYRAKSLEEHKFDLCKAAVLHDVSKVTALLAFGTPVDFAIHENWRYRINGGYGRMPAPAWGDLPLIHMVAMISYDTVILDALINAGGNVHVTHEITGGGGYETSGSILHNTLNLHTHAPVFQRLIEAGADVNAKNSRGISVVRALLITNSCFNKSNNIREDKITILKLLIRSGATLAEADVANMLKLVASKPITDADIELLQLCLDNNFTLTPATGGNILHGLASNLIIDSPIKRAFIQKIITAGTPLNSQDLEGRTPLYLAAQNPSFMDVLLEQKDDESKDKVDVNLADSKGITPLHCAAKTSPACVEKLLAHNANKDAADQNGATIVHYAADKQTLATLLQHGAKCDVPDNDGTTPLMLAIAAAILTNASALLSAGADIWAKNKKQKTILDFAISNPHALTYVQAEMTRQQHEISVPSGQRLALV